ncbi:enhanced entry protein EnhB [Legionella lansingensis]|uniref:Enhanced entry protein EnhB n=1 Tax=Legionella lansingensis TaxID=45067 RepID=A0A0W0VXU9_9GAMM|nr:hypothetical protein [Legionella lansingensis]KTD24734.1 enhanced entry protein EnhB [Legionella lansingensis]SNV53612.1 enhanced entry protein EnhB [Legionella lansingensis]
MKHFNNYLIVIIISMIALPIFARKDVAFRGCMKVGFQFANKLFTLEPKIIGHPQTIYFIHNTSSNSIDLQVNKSTDLTYVSYKNQIEANQWAAFATDEKRFTFACYLSDGANKDIDCQKVLEICQYTDTKFPEGNNGNYWAVKSDRLEKAVKDVIKQGILLKW